MRSHTLALAVALALVLAVLSPGSAALQHTLKIRGDLRTVFFIENFGFVPHGRLVIEITQFSLLYPFDVVVSPSRVDDFRVGFLVRRTASDSAEFVSSSSTSCLLDKMKADDILFSMADRRNWTKVSFEHTVHVGEEDLFNIYFVNCEKDAESSFNAYIAAWNPGPSYLSAGKAPEPMMLSFFAFLYCICLGIFIRFMRLPDAEVKSVHYLMAAMVVVKIVTLFVTAGRLHYMDVTGQGHGWNAAYYVFTFLRGVMLFVIITLVGLGWSSVHAHMAPRDKKILLVVIVLQVISSIALIMTSELSPGAPNWVTWFDILRIVDIVACGVILFPIVWSIKHLRDAASTDGKAALAQLKLKLFRESYLAVVAWIYVTRIVVFLLEATLPYRRVWVAELFGEASTLAFYMYAGYAFRPMPSNQFLRLAQYDSDEDEGVVLDEVVRNNDVA